MSKIAAWSRQLRQFLDEVNVELKKCAWPTRPELMQSTVVVIVSVILLSAFVALSDVVTRFALEAVIR